MRIELVVAALPMDSMGGAFSTTHEPRDRRKPSFQSCHRNGHCRARELENTLKKCNQIINLQPNLIKVLQNFSSSAYGEIYTVGLNMFLDNPITGVGISNYQTSCINISEYRDLMVNYDCASHPHNLYIQWLSEGGIITFVSFLLLLFNILYYI